MLRTQEILEMALLEYTWRAGHGTVVPGMPRAWEGRGKVQAPRARNLVASGLKSFTTEVVIKQGMLLNIAQL